MNGRERFLALLAAYEVLPVLDHSVRYGQVTPGVQLFYIVVPLGESQAVVTVTQRSYDEVLARRIEAALIRLAKPDVAGMAIAETCDLGDRFDVLVVLPPRGHGVWQNELPDLYPSTFVAFPVARCELPADADLPTIQYLRTRTDLNSTDWGREIEPAVFFAYHNGVTQEGTTSREPKLGSYKLLQRAFKSLAEKSDESSWILARNWRSESIRASFDRRHGTFDFSGASDARVAPADVETALLPFFAG